MSNNLKNTDDLKVEDDKAAMPSPYSSGGYANIALTYPQSPWPTSATLGPAPAHWTNTAGVPIVYPPYGAASNMAPYYSPPPTVPTAVSGVDWGTLLSNSQTLSNIMPVGNEFIVLKSAYDVRAHGISKTLVQWLDECKNIRYLKSATEVVILRTVWDTIFEFMKAEEAYADMNLSEFLDKVFAVKSPPPACDLQPAI